MPIGSETCVHLGEVPRNPEDLGIPSSEKHSCRALWEVKVSGEVCLFKNYLDGLVESMNTVRSRLAVHSEST